MATKIKQAVKKPATLKKSSLPFTVENYFLFFAGLLCIVSGYILMGTGDVNGALSLTVSPIVLSIGYLIIIPAAILYRKKNKEETSQPA